jgi:predicted acyltransferase
MSSSLANPDQPEAALANRPAEPGAGRLLAIDAMRGLVMANLVLLRPLLPAVAGMPSGPLRNFLNQQLHHSAWHGLTETDVTFAAFVMMMGIMIPMSLRRHIRDGDGRRALYGKILKRSVVLFGLGVLYNGGFSHAWPDIRLAGILQRLAICYMAGAVIYLNCNKWVRIALTPAILLGYWGVMALVAVPGGTPGDYTFEGNLATWVDRHYLPGRAFFGTWDPEGILTTIPALASCLIGILWGDLLQSRCGTPEKLVWLAGGGLVAINVGVIWDSNFPINKNLWTSSYVLVTAGIASLVLATCYLIADVWKRPGWLFPLIVIGTNLLPAYLITGMIPLKPLVARLVGGDVAAVLGTAAPLVAGMVEVALVWGALYWMYRRNLVLKV